MNILLDSLALSPYANEQWTLGDTGVELVLATEPKNAFKKRGYEVLVLYDHKPESSYPYTNWDNIYYQDLNDMWIKTPGLVDYNGLYYEEPDGTKAYFTLFADNAHRYGHTGEWTVQYRNKTIYPPVTSSRPSGGPSEEVLVISDSGSEGSDGASVTSPRRETTVTFAQPSDQTPGPSTSISEAAPRARRRLGQGESGAEPPVKKAKADSTGGRRAGGGGPSPRRRGGGGGGGERRGDRGEQSPVPAEEVGRRHRSVTERGLTRLGRLQEEARDPPVIIVQGCPNSLKCWRNRLPKRKGLYENVTTVFHWVMDTYTADRNGRVLVAFSSTQQRQQFISAVTIPRHCSFTLGSLNEL